MAPPLEMTKLKKPLKTALLYSSFLTFRLLFMTSIKNAMKLARHNRWTNTPTTNELRAIRDSTSPWPLLPKAFRQENSNFSTPLRLHFSYLQLPPHKTTVRPVLNLLNSPHGRPSTPQPHQLCPLPDYNWGTCIPFRDSQQPTHDLLFKLLIKPLTLSPS